MNPNCRCGMGFNPHCNVDHGVEAEREELDLAEVRAILRGLRSFRADAMADCPQDAWDALERCRRAHDLCGFRAHRTAILDAHADSKFRAATDHGWRSLGEAAHIVKRSFQKYEHTDYTTSLHSDGRDGSPTAGLSSDRRAA